MTPRALDSVSPYYDPRAAFHGSISMAQVGWRQHHQVSRGFTVHLRHGRGQGGSGFRVAINHFGWSPLSTSPHGSISPRTDSRPRSLGAIIYTIVGSGASNTRCTSQSSSAVTTPPLPPIYGVRASSGHSIGWLMYREMMVPLTRADTDHLLAMCHGTTRNHIPSMLQIGLWARGVNRLGRAHVMFSMFPHFDTRQLTGQRFPGDSLARIPTTTMGNAATTLSCLPTLVA